MQRSDLIMMSYIGSDNDRVNDGVDDDVNIDFDIDFDPFVKKDANDGTIDSNNINDNSDNNDKKTMLKALKNEKLKKVYIGGSIVSSLIVGSMIVAPVLGPIMIAGPVAAYCIYKLNGL